MQASETMQDLIQTINCDSHQQLLQQFRQLRSLNPEPVV